MNEIKLVIVSLKTSSMFPTTHTKQYTAATVSVTTI